mmetsp:Transcript_13194/g.28969  ORF Transcript_13194/g.28969 Transcript_13194/m.28969 type:complete len:101 (-) Transcript_13194:1836-2138(-)
MSGQFFQRIINYVANEIIVKGLANSKTFQKFAVKSDHHMRQFQKTGEEAVNKTLDELNKNGVSGAAASGFSGPPQPPLTGVPGFVSAFFKEIGKDLGLRK